MDPSKPKIPAGPFRFYDVSARKVLSGTRALLCAAGYVLLPSDPVGFVKPSLRARREWGQKSNEILCIARPGLRRALDGLVHLAAAREVLGDSVEYALLLPPVHEFHLIEFLQGNDDRISREIKKRGFLFWMYNPVEDALVSFTGSSRDPIFGMSPLMPGLLTRELLKRKPGDLTGMANLFKFMPNKGF